MKKILFMVSLTLAAVPVTRASDQGAFISVSAGQSRLLIDRASVPDRRDRAITLFTGYRWSVAPSFSLGVEAGYGDLGKASGNSYSEYVLTDINGVDHVLTWRERRYYQTKAYLLGVNGQWDITDRWNLSAHLGAAKYRTNFVIASHGTFDNLSDDSRSDYKERRGSHYYGLSTGYKLSDHVELSLTLDRYHPSFSFGRYGTETYSLNVWGVKAEYSF
ncbi:MAG TPA: outer membrane beta-barrel protein [Luteibacter sp.]|uniref:outer membrane beta-barrel protein n=1 Tax=Luteibacter sp. TaxID=1886636 RepID=UPI002C51C936|nr:outer membrane beta-barrel protein [Luteibacter sp.]HVI55611.1 outer membrane beta-barrel protein [Luteibacter sp.]